VGRKRVSQVVQPRDVTSGGLQMEMQNAGAPAKRSPGKYLPVKNKRAANENGKQEEGKPGVLRVHPAVNTRFQNALT